MQGAHPSGLAAAPAVACSWGGAPSGFAFPVSAAARLSRNRGLTERSPVRFHTGPRRCRLAHDRTHLCSEVPLRIREQGGVDRVTKAQAVHHGMNGRIVTDLALDPASRAGRLPESDESPRARGGSGWRCSDKPALHALGDLAPELRSHTDRQGWSRPCLCRA